MLILIQRRQAGQAKLREGRKIRADQSVFTRSLVGPGSDSLIGTKLLNPHCLEIDYSQRIVELVSNPDW